MNVFAICVSPLRRLHDEWISTQYPYSTHCPLEIYYIVPICVYYMDNESKILGYIVPLEIYMGLHRNILYRSFAWIRSTGIPYHTDATTICERCINKRAVLATQQVQLRTTNTAEYTPFAAVLERIKEADGEDADSRASSIALTDTSTATLPEHTSHHTQVNALYTESHESAPVEKTFVRGATHITRAHSDSQLTLSRVVQSPRTNATDGVYVLSDNRLRDCMHLCTRCYTYHANSSFVVKRLLALTGIAIHVPVYQSNENTVRTAWRQIATVLKKVGIPIGYRDMRARPTIAHLSNISTLWLTLTDVPALYNTSITDSKYAKVTVQIRSRHLWYTLSSRERDTFKQSITQHGLRLPRVAPECHCDDAERGLRVCSYMIAEARVDDEPPEESGSVLPYWNNNMIGAGYQCTGCYAHPTAIDIEDILGIYKTRTGSHHEHVVDVFLFKLD